MLMLLRYETEVTEHLYIIFTYYVYNIHINSKSDISPRKNGYHSKTTSHLPLLTYDLYMLFCVVFFNTPVSF